MYRIKDIRVYKNNLRAKYKKIRIEMKKEAKSIADKRIYDRLISLISYRNCKTVYVYVSTPIEVDTRRFIERALSDGKTVAVPRCVPNTRFMEFYKINSLSELVCGSFSVDEPMPIEENLMYDFNDSICIVPGLCFDKKGYRLGYGKGYYDRFLSNFEGNIIGICYSNCITNELFTGRYDRKCSLVVTERGIFNT